MLFDSSFYYLFEEVNLMAESSKEAPCSLFGKIKWLVVAVEAKFGWPTEETELKYRGCKYLLRPESEEYAQSVALLCPSDCDMKYGRLLMSRFLSALAWSKGGGIIELFALGGGGAPIQVGKNNASLIEQPFKVYELPEPNDEKSLFALALFREALSLNSPAYSFLGFFKALNILFKRGNDQKRWVNDNITEIKEHGASKRLKELLKSHNDLGEYLYHQGRCAIAHA